MHCILCKVVVTKTMEINTTDALLALASLVIALALIISKLTSITQKLPPGPKPWPIIGNLHLIGPVQHRSLHLLSRKYGDIMQLKFGTFPVVVISSPEIAKQVLKMHDKLSSSRLPLTCGKYINYDYSNVLWAQPGPYWRQARRIIISKMLTTSKLGLYEHIRVEETRNFLSRLHAASGKPVVLQDHITRYSLCIMARTVFGDRQFCESKNVKAVSNLDELQGLVDEWFLLTGARCVGDWIPWLGFLDLEGWVKKMKAFSKKFDVFIEFLIDDHLTNRAIKDANVPQDVLDSFLQLAEDPNLEVQLTREHIKGIIQDLLTGGTDTSSCAIEWAIHEMIKQPQIIEKAKEELDRVIGRNRSVEENDLSQLPYLEAIIMESFRLHPPSPLLPPHYTIEDCNVAGYDIPKGTTFTINAWSVGRDPNTWDAPEEFLPERFLGKEIDLANNFTLLPFGSGRRMCPAYKFGLNAVRATLANLLHGFDWKLPEDTKLEDVCMEEQCRLTMHPAVPIAIIMEPTLPVD